MLAVAVNAVAEVRRGAGVAGGAQCGGGATGGEGMPRVLSGGGATFALVLALAFASLSSPLLSDGMRTWVKQRRESGNLLWSDFMPY